MKTCDWQSVDSDMIVRCTTCGKEFRLHDLQAVAQGAMDVPNYCPNCGAETNKTLREDYE